MAPLATSKATIKKQTERDMKKLGVFRPEYAQIVDIYAGLVEQYHKLMKEYRKETGYRYSTGTGAAGEKKSPLVSTLEGVRRDILAYSDRLCINPRAEREMKQTPEKGSKLEGLLHNA